MNSHFTRFFAFGFCIWLLMHLGFAFMYNILLLHFTFGLCMCIVHLHQVERSLFVVNYVAYFSKIILYWYIYYEQQQLIHFFTLTSKTWQFLKIMIIHSSLIFDLQKNQRFVPRTFTQPEPGQPKSLAITVVAKFSHSSKNILSKLN